jgi:hypothetical protein
MTVYPVTDHDYDIRRGHRCSNFVWYHPVDEQQSKGTRGCLCFSDAALC